MKKKQTWIVFRWISEGFQTVKKRITENKAYKKINKFNDAVALVGTKVFGTMWMCYLFFVYGLLPTLVSKWMDTLLYWSNTVQLWSLPLLMVGQNLMNRSSEKRMQKMYEMLKQDLNLAREDNAMLKAKLSVLENKLDLLISMGVPNG
jgi:hypothetical protein